jgi:prepilin-type N-terminal cleavage/methylation domain-containing protein
MISLKKNNKGFTIVELLIVIVVIGILALLVITTYGGIQSKARNSKRQADIQAIATQVEAYYSQNQYYPSLGNMNDAAWRGLNMKSLDAQALLDPSNPNQKLTGAGANATPLVDTPAAKSYRWCQL